MAKKQRELPELTPAQGEIMDIIWHVDEISASEVRRILSKTRKVARNTVRTLLERMEEKGWITHREEGRTFLYSAAQPRQATIGQKVKEIVDTVCGGSPEALVTALLDYRGLNSGELERIRQMLAQARAAENKKGGS
jgi:BlaI family transcriptional regulator, penicillinase repressor